MHEGQRPSDEHVDRRRTVLTVGGIVVAGSLAVAGLTAGYASGILPTYHEPTPTPESAENYAIDHDRYSTLLSDGGHGVVCYSNDMPTKKPVGTEFEVIIPASNTYCEEANSYLLPGTDRQALGIPEHPEGAIDIFVSAVTITDRDQNSTPSASR